MHTHTFYASKAGEETEAVYKELKFICFRFRPYLQTVAMLSLFLRFLVSAICEGPMKLITITLLLIEFLIVSYKYVTHILDEMKKNCPNYFGLGCRLQLSLQNSRGLCDAL